jgi:hypothetical protein
MQHQILGDGKGAAATGHEVNAATGLHQPEPLAHVFTALLRPVFWPEHLTSPGTRTHFHRRAEETGEVTLI